MQSKPIDIYTRGAVATYLDVLAKQGQIKECQHMRLEYGRWYKATCEKDFAERVDATNIPRDITGLGGPTRWWWPRCPENCPFFTPVTDKTFLVSVSRDQYSKEEGRSVSIRTSDNAGAKAAVSALPEVAGKAPLKHPERMTVPWLWHNASPSFWWTALGALAAMFVLGVTSTRLTIVRELFGLASNSVQAASPSTFSTVAPDAAQNTAK